MGQNYNPIVLLHVSFSNNHGALSVCQAMFQEETKAVTFQLRGTQGSGAHQGRCDHELQQCSQPRLVDALASCVWGQGVPHSMNQPEAQLPPEREESKAPLEGSQEVLRCLGAIAQQGSLGHRSLKAAAWGFIAPGLILSKVCKHWVQCVDCAKQTDVNG